MRRRQYVYFHVQGTHVFKTTAIQAHFIVQDHIPYHIILHIVVIIPGKFLHIVCQALAFGNTCVRPCSTRWTR